MRSRRLRTKRPPSARRATVAHLASTTSTNPPARGGGTFQVLDALRHHARDARFVLASSAAVYGEPGAARWTRSMLADPRFGDYFAERMARGFVGTEGGEFFVYRRDRFVTWLSSRLRDRAPYDGMVAEMIASEGLWTDKPATNFITAAIVDEKIDRMRLAGRTVRAFLGQRIDCAQCHDHPFASWKQSQFEGLAAFFADVQTTGVGLEDKPGGELEVVDRSTKKKRVVAPSAPFGPEWLPATGRRRERLAAWVTDSRNGWLARAVVNRVWGYMFGRPYVEPLRQDRGRRSEPRTG